MGQFEEDEVKWVLLGSGLMVILCAGTVYAFGAFSNELKRSLQLSQTQLELGALAANLGNYIGIAGFFFDKYGAVKSSYVGAVLMGVGYGARPRGLWLLSKTAGDLSGAQGFAALLVCCFTYGHGSSYLDVSVATVVRAFPGHRGAVVGLLKSFYGLAASLVILFAGHVYSQSTQLPAPVLENTRKARHVLEAASSRGAFVETALNTASARPVSLRRLSRRL
ncbi:Nodulin-like-domain-containing protein [Pelagophyceae sp. CCMP2097]|nr:Nodulin-like-domain-containing protein [Pelagophyceae sp. CCMP2097]